jgi:hypothetical protein
MRDLLRDWQRWTRGERITVVLFATFLLIGMTAAVGANLYGTLTGHNMTGLGGPF